jgi:hypothetical protein
MWVGGKGGKSEDKQKQERPRQRVQMQEGAQGTRGRIYKSDSIEDRVRCIQRSESGSVLSKRPEVGQTWLLTLYQRCNDASAAA